MTRYEQTDQDQECWMVTHEYYTCNEIKAVRCCQTHDDVSEDGISEKTVEGERLRGGDVLHSFESEE